MQRKIVPSTTALVYAALLLGGCQGAVWGNFAALLVAVSLFVGTLQLGRRPSAPRPPSASGSATQTHH